MRVVIALRDQLIQQTDFIGVAGTGNRRLFTMAFSLNKLKNMLNNNREGQLAGSGSLEPEIGFKLALHPVAKNLFVTVIGARHLPSLFGLSRAHGYLVKVTSEHCLCFIYL